MSHYEQAVSLWQGWSRPGLWLIPEDWSSVPTTGFSGPHVRRQVHLMKLSATVSHGIANG